MRLKLGLGFVGAALMAAMVMPLAFSASGPAAAQTVGPQKSGKATAKKSSAKSKDATDGKAGRSSAETDRLLDGAAKAIADGKPDAAMATLDGVLAGGGLANNHMARALYLRGVAHRRKGRPAQAIADLTSAIWLKGGLNDADRTAALKERDDVSREVGVAETTTPEGSVRPAAIARSEPAASPAAAPRVVTAPLPVAPAPARLIASPPPAPSGELSEGGFPRARSAAASQAAAAPPPSTPSAGSGSSGGLGDFFSGLFTGNSSSGSAGPSGQAKRSTEVSGWSTSTRGSDKKSPAKPDRIVTSSAPQAPVAVAGGRYRLQIATVRSRKEADSVAARVKRDHARVIGARKLEVDETVFGNMGTFYRVGLGPFAAADEPKVLCDRLRSSGYDCLVVTQ